MEWMEKAIFKAVGELWIRENDDEGQVCETQVEHGETNGR